VQPVQVVRQRAQRVAGEVEHFERVRQLEDLGRQLGQAAAQVEALCPGQLARAQAAQLAHQKTPKR